MPANKPTSQAPQAVLAAIDDPATQADTKVLLEMMGRISGCKPKIWNVSTFGFDSYHYKYESGREGDCHVLGLNARKGKFTIYLMDGTSRHMKQLEKLGKHTVSKACLYFRRLSDLQLPVLEQILRDSHAWLKAHDGRVQRAE